MALLFCRTVFPRATLILDWVLNEHCRLDIADLVDLSLFPWIHRRAGSPLPAGAPWAASDVTPTRWDSLDEWRRHRAVVSVSIHLYRFIPPEFCRSTMAALKLQPAVQERITARGPGRPIAHVRTGDILRWLSPAERTALETQITTTLATLPSDTHVLRYTADTLQREPNDIREAMADLLYAARICSPRAYCPFSHFSSWIVLLSDAWRPDLPLFDYRRMRVEVILPPPPPAQVDSQ